MKKQLFVWAGLGLLLGSAACQRQGVEMPEPEVSIEEPFTFTAVAGVDTRVSAEFGDTQNIINFKWSEDDSLFVCFVEADSLALYPYNTESYKVLHSNEFNSRWETYVFKLKSGAGTSRAVFQSTDFSPSEIMKSGVSYVMSAVYHPADPANCWSIWDAHVQTSRLFQTQQQYNPESPLQNVADNVMLGSYPVDVTADSSPVVRFAHGMFLYRVRIKNVGSDLLSVQSIDVPGGNEYSDFYALSDGKGYTPRYFGEKRYIISMQSSVEIAPGETSSFYLAMMPSFILDEEWCNNWTHIVNLSNGHSIRVDKNPPVGMKFLAGHMYSTTLTIRADMATDGEIPPIQGSDGDDF